MLLFPNARILYVDDDRDSCELMSFMLSAIDSGCQVMTVSDSKEAVSLIEDDLFDLYILDFALPEITGVELCQIIRQKNEQIPVLFYSGMSRERDKRDALQAGATEYLVKPNDLDKIAGTVESLLNRAPPLFFKMDLSMFETVRP
jgi:DNA-binding response OmpR family regulator